MNNRAERIAYLKSINPEQNHFFEEETFIINVAKNDFAMKYVRKKLETFKDLLDIVNFDISQEYSYNLKSMVGKCTDVIENLKLVLFYIAYSEKTNQLDLIEILFKKSFSKIHKGFRDCALKLTLDATQNSIILFYMAFTNFNFYQLLDNAKDILRDASCIVGNDSALHFVVKDIDSLKEEFKDIIKKYKLEKNIIIKDIINKIESDYLVDFASFLRKKGYSNDKLKELSFGATDEFFSLEEAMLNTNKYESITSFRQFRYLLELLERFTIQKDEILNCKLNSDDIEVIFSLLSFLFERTYLDENDKEIFFLNAMLFYVLFKKLNDGCSVITKNIIDSHNKEIISYKESLLLEDTISDLKSENDSLKNTIKNKDLEIEQLKKELALAKSSINSLKDERNKIIEDKRELVNLRELFFDLEQEDCKLETKNDYKIDDSLKIAFVGGSDNLRLKVKNLFPSFTIVSPEDVGKDLTYLRTMDYIFIHIHMSHSMYYKTIDIIRTNDIDFSFINEVNIDILKNNILNKLSNR